MSHKVVFCQESMSQREQDCLQPGVDPKLLIDARNVTAHRLGADEEALRNALVVKARRQGSQNLLLTAAQVLQGHVPFSVVCQVQVALMH